MKNIDSTQRTKPLKSAEKNLWKVKMEVALAERNDGEILIAGINYKYTYIPGKPPTREDEGECDYFVIDDIQRDGTSIMDDTFELLESMCLWDILEERLFIIIKEGRK